MTEARLPEREPGQPGKRTRITHIRDRGTFDPRAPQEVNPNLFTPAADRVKPLTVPPIFQPEAGEEETSTSAAPDYAPQKRGISRRTFLKMAAGTTAVAAEGALESQNMGIFSLIKSLFPKGKNETKAALPAAPTTEKGTDKTPTATQTKEVVAPEDQKSPHERGYTETHDNVILSVEKGMEGRTQCPNPDAGGAGMVTCNPQTKVTLNTDDYHDAAEQMLSDAVLNAKYDIWKKRNTQDAGITLAQFQEKLKGDTPLLITAKGMVGSSFLPTTINIDLRKPVEFMWVKEPQLHKFSTGNSTTTRLADGKVIFEIYDGASGKAFLDGTQPERYRYAAAGWVLRSFSYLSNESYANRGGFLSPEENTDTTQYVLKLRDKFIPRFGVSGLFVSY